MKNRKEITAKINAVKRTLQGRTIVLPELVERFKAQHIPSHPLFIYKFANLCMIRIKHGEYVFRNSEPIYFKTVEEIFRQINKNNQKQRERFEQNEQKILEAISLLKTNGYKVLKPTFEEI